jgi:MFS family permease
LASDISPSEKYGSKMGLLSSIEMAGYAVGSVMGGLIADMFGFHALWTFVAVDCLVGAIVFLVWGSDPTTIVRGTRSPFLTNLRNLDFVGKISVLYLSCFLFILGFTLLGPNLNVYFYDELEFSRTTVGILSFAGTGISTLVQPILGAYSDKHGRKAALLIGGFTLPIGNIILFLARDLPTALVARILISNFNIFRLIGSSYIADIVPQTSRSSALGFFGSVNNVSWALGSLMGGYIIGLADTRTLILISTIFPIVSLAIVYFILKESKVVKKPKKS